MGHAWSHTRGHAVPPNHPFFWVCMCHYAPKKHRKSSGLSCDFWEDSRRISLSYAFDSHISIVFLVINPQLLAGKPDKVRWWNPSLTECSIHQQPHQQKLRQKDLIPTEFLPPLHWTSCSHRLFGPGAETSPKPASLGSFGSRDATNGTNGCKASGENHEFSMRSNHWLVVWTPLKNMRVHWDDYSQYMGK